MRWGGALASAHIRLSAWHSTSTADEEQPGGCYGPASMRAAALVVAAGGRAGSSFAAHCSVGASDDRPSGLVLGRRSTPAADAGGGVAGAVATSRRSRATASALRGRAGAVTGRLRQPTRCDSRPASRIGTGASGDLLVVGAYPDAPAGRWTPDAARLEDGRRKWAVSDRTGTARRGLRRSGRLGGAPISAGPTPRLPAARRLIAPKATSPTPIIREQPPRPSAEPRQDEPAAARRKRRSGRAAEERP